MELFPSPNVPDFEVPFISELSLTLFTRCPLSRGPEFLLEMHPDVLIPDVLRL